MSTVYPISNEELGNLRKGIHAELRSLLVTSTTLPLSTKADGTFVNAVLLEDRIADITRLITDFALSTPAQHEQAFKHEMANQRVAFSAYISKNFDTQEGINIFDYLEAKTHLKIYETLSQKLILEKANQEWLEFFTKKHKPDYSITWKEHIEGLEQSIEAMKKTFPGYPDSFTNLPASKQADLMQGWRIFSSLIIDDRYKKAVYGGFQEALMDAENELMLSYRECGLPKNQAKNAVKTAYNTAKEAANNLRPRFPPKTDEKLLVDIKAYSDLVEAIFKKMTEGIDSLQVKYDRGQGFTPLSAAKSPGNFLTDPNYLLQDLAHTIASQAVREELHGESAEEFARRLKAHQRSISNAFNATGIAGIPHQCQIQAGQFAQECVALAWPACKEFVKTNNVMTNASIKKEPESYARSIYKALIGNRLDCSRDSRIPVEEDDYMFVEMQGTRETVKALIAQNILNPSPNNTRAILYKLAGKFASRNDELLELEHRLEEFQTRFAEQNKLHARLGYSRLEAHLTP